MPQHYSNRIALISGASSGIGKAAVLRLARHSINMVLTGRNEEKLAEVAAMADEIAGRSIALCVGGDIADNTVIPACIEAGRQQWNDTPAIFIACAGRGLPGTLLNSDTAQWDSLIDTNVKGLFYQLKYVAESMLEKLGPGRDILLDPLDIIVIGSSIGRNVSPFNSVYGATKFAAHGITEGLRRQVGPQGIRVTLIEPGLVGTNFQEAAGYNKEWFQSYSKEVGPILGADDVAQVIEFLIGLPGNVNLDNISVRPTRQAYP